MMRTKLLIFTCALGALLLGAANASATLTYQKGNSIYVASNSGKSSKLLVTNGRQPLLTPNGLTVIYKDTSQALFAVPVVGGTPVRLQATDCSECVGMPSPDSASLAFVNANGELDLIPLSGGAPLRLATQVYSQATFSPDSKQIVFDQGAVGATKLFTVPATGGAPTGLATVDAIAPLWTDVGVVATTLVKVGVKPQFRTVLLDATGKIKRVLYRKTIQSEKALSSGRGIAIAFQPAGPNYIAIEYGKGKRGYLTVASASTGKVKAKRSFKDLTTVRGISYNGKTLITVTKGKLEAVNFKTGKRKTLIKKGVKTASMN